MSISDWPLWAKISTGAAAVGVITGLWANAVAIAESDLQPFALKYQIAAENKAILDGLNQIQWNQAIDRFAGLQFQLGQLATQQIMLSDAVKREPENVLARLRLQEMDADIAQKKAAYRRLQCQIEARNTGAACP